MAQSTSRCAKAGATAMTFGVKSWFCCGEERSEREL